MRRYFLVMIAAWSFYSCKMTVPSSDCHRFENGTFKMVTEGRTTTIERKGSEQLEYLMDIQEPFTFIVKWTDDCTYTLTPTARTLERGKLPKNAMVTVNITSTTKYSYIQTTTSNFNDKKLTCEIFKIK